MTLFVGIDIHKRTHEVAILNEHGVLQGQIFKISNSHQGLTTLLQTVAAHNIDQQPVYFGLEATAQYWLCLYSHLKEHYSHVIPINPLQTSAYRNLRLRRTKNDRIDAQCVAQVLQQEINEQHTHHLPEYLFVLRTLTRSRTTVAQQIHDAVLRLHAVMDQLFPEFTGLFTKPFGATGRAILLNYPTPDIIAALSVDDFAAFIRRRSYGQLGKERAQALIDAAKNTFGIKIGQEALGIQVQLMAQQLHMLHDQRKTLDKHIEKKIAQHSAYITTIPGIGSVAGATILAEIGDIARFKNANSLVAFAGLDPTVSESAQVTLGRSRISKRGSPRLRRSLWLAAGAATRTDAGFAAILEKKLKEGKHYHVALGAVMNKLIHVIYAVLRDKKPYYPVANTLAMFQSEAATASLSSAS